MNTDILALDIGTSSCKAMVLSESGKVLALGRGSYRLIKAKNGWVEQDIGEILEGIKQSLSAVQSETDLRRVSCIGISAQMAAQCPIGHDDKPMTNLLSWMDRRAEQETDEYYRCFTQEETARLTGMDMLITPAHTITKLRWLYRNRPALSSSARYIAQIKDILIHELTGNWVSDATTLKGVVRQDNGAPIPEILRFTGFSESIVPPVKKPYERAGYLKRNALGFSQWREGIPVAVGWNDMNAAFLGMAGVSEDDIGLDLTGTSEHFGIMTRHVPAAFKARGVNRVPFIDDREVCYGVTSSGGQAFDWFMRNIYAADDLSSAYTEVLSRLAGHDPEENESLIFLPYIEGERNPWNMPAAKGVFFGLNSSHTKLHMAWAVMEGVCFALRTILERMPLPPQRIIVAGGSARNDVWNQLKANVLQIPYEKLHTTEAGCNGAAILASCCKAPGSDMGKIAASMIATTKHFTPEPGKADAYRRKYARYLHLVDLMQEDFGRKNT